MRLSRLVVTIVVLSLNIFSIPAFASNAANLKCQGIRIDDANPCTTDVCNPTTGAISHMAISCPRGSSCSIRTGKCESTSSTNPIPVSLRSSVALELQRKVSTTPGRVKLLDSRIPKKRGEEREEEGKEEFKPFAISFLAATPILNMKDIDYAPGTWEKITGTGSGTYWSVSVYTNPNDHIVEEILAVVSGQLWKWDVMTNQAKWAQITINNINNEIIEAQVDPNDKDHFIVVVKEIDKKNNNVNVYSTSNAGKTWSLALSLYPNPKEVSARFFDSNHLMLIHRNDGVFISSNSGKTWKNTKKADFDHWERESQSVTNTGKGLIYSTNEKALYATFDYGQTWKKVKDLTGLFEKPGKKMTISYALTDSIMYMITTWGCDKNVYSSVDGGNNWDTIETDMDSCSPDQSFVIDKNNKDHLLVSSYMAGPFESFDGGKTWVKYYSKESGLKANLVKEINCDGCGIPLDIRGTFVDNFGNIFYAADQGLFMIIPASKKGDNPSLSNIAQPLSFEDAGDIKTDLCGNLYYGVWHRSPVVKTTNGYYYAAGPEKQGFILTDPAKCLNAPALPIGTSIYHDIHNYVQNSQSFDLSFTFKDFKGTPGNVVYFKNKLYAVTDQNKLNRLDIFSKLYSPELVLENIIYIFKNVDDNILYAVDSSGIIWNTSDGEIWSNQPIPSVGDSFNMLSGTAVGKNFILAFDFLFIGSVDGGKTIKSWPNSDGIIRVLASKPCQTRLFGIAKTKDSFGVDIQTVKISYDFGQTWNEFGEGISGPELTQLFLGDTDNKYLYIATTGKGVWRRSTEELLCKKWIDVEEKVSTIKNQQLCSANATGPIINVDDDFDAFCYYSEWAECNADGIPYESTSKDWLIPTKRNLSLGTYTGISSDGYHHLYRYDNYLCSSYSSTAGKQQNGYHGFETWYVCGKEKKGDGGVQSNVGDIVNKHTCTANGWASNPIVFENKTLEAHVKGELHLNGYMTSNENVITDDIAQHVTTLNLVGKYIENFNQLSSFTSLDHLNLSNNKLTNLTPLSGLAQLEVLDLSNNQLSDLTPLSGLKQLKDLDTLGNSELNSACQISEHDGKEKVQAALKQCLDKP